MLEIIANRQYVHTRHGELHFLENFSDRHSDLGFEDFLKFGKVISKRLHT